LVAPQRKIVGNKELKESKSKSEDLTSEDCNRSKEVRKLSVIYRETAALIKVTSQSGLGYVQIGYGDLIS
jgi:hypothetical protein